MKKFLCLIIAVILVFIILRVSVADVNYGYGPGYHIEEQESHETGQDYQENTGH